MAKTPSSSAAPTKEEKKAAKAASKVEKKERRSQLWQVFKTQIREDKRLLPYLILTILLTTAVFVLLGLWLFTWWVGLVFGLAIGAMLAMLLFARRVQANVYKQADGTPGAAAWSLQNNLRGQWRITPAIAGTAQLDAVHRVIGRPGIVLVGEGAPHRVKPLLAQEKKRIARVVGETPIYDIIVGNGDGEVPLRKLNSYMTKLPRNISSAQVGELDTRLNALGNRSPQSGLPKGPLPAGAKMRSVQRAAKRAR
jgi:Domain of unknown function (DUF4191)